MSQGIAYWDYKDLNETIERIDWYSRLLEINDITGRIITVLEKGEMQAKRNIISSLGSNLTWNDEKLLINNKKEVDVLIEGMKSVKELYPKFEPKNYVVDTVLKEKTGSFEPAFSTMLRTWEDVRNTICINTK